VERREALTDALGMSSRAPSTSLPGRIVTSPRLRPILTVLAAVVLLTGGALPVVAQSSGIAASAASVLAPADAIATTTPAAATDLGSARVAGDLPTPPVSVALETADPGATTAPVTAPAVVVKKASAKPAPPKIAPPKIAPPKVAPGPTPVKHVAYSGTNHVWIPSLGIDRSVYGFACTRSKAPDNLTYRWGCSASNNVYLLGHAYGVFKPLHDAYYNGKLQKGMKVMYADATGTVHTYSVLWWKVVKPTTDAAWAWASLSSPGMTLQTCLGATSAYRLMVRLDQVD